ncbi:hypothetical protein REMIM1_PE00280 (plasmid) [Rhizobium etli bv. mimosae str. Mim1]|nr:hypothetical protein REMIM1_PE00280 [Rhizobium etli bv. mimosae str. Mim1]
MAFPEHVPQIRSINAAEHRTFLYASIAKRATSNRTCHCRIMRLTVGAVAIDC